MCDRTESHIGGHHATASLQPDRQTLLTQRGLNMKSVTLLNADTSQDVFSAPERSSLTLSEGTARVFEQPALVVEPQNSLTAEQQKAAAQVLGQAFAKDSFMAYMLPNRSTRAQQLSKLFLPLIYASQRHGEVNVAPGGGGVLAWVPGQFFSRPVNFLELFRSGMLWLPWSVGRTAFKRFKDHDEVCEQALLQHVPKNFAYLWAVGVHPDQTGQGLGKKMVNTALSQMRDQGYSTCWLRTENPNNVGLYEYLGFEHVHTEIPSASGQQYWLMFQNL
ncbi:MAG: GNAT family N-acetyltransferase [Cyanobacteria bacterium P01_A01_bin.17]